MILHGLQKVTFECQVISNDPSVTSMVLMVQNRRKCITYNKVIVGSICFGRHEVLFNGILNYVDHHSASINMKFTVQLHSMSTLT